MKQKYTREQIAAFMKQIHAEWRETKERYNTDLTMQEAYRQAMQQIENLSQYGFAHVAYQMQKLNLPGFPVIDCKTFAGWKKEGFRVKKGEHSNIRGITWRPISNEVDNNGTTEEEKFMIPKIYHLFHRSQVEEIE